MDRKRFSHVLFSLFFLLFAGVSYGIFVKMTGIGIPCPFRIVTGWKCPGCGVTHMCVALLQLDFETAFAANPAILMLSPILVLVFMPCFVGYVKNGNRQLGHLQNITIWCCIIILILFGILRNINSVPE